MHWPLKSINIDSYFCQFLLSIWWILQKNYCINIVIDIKLAAHFCIKKCIYRFTGHYGIYDDGSQFIQLRKIVKREQLISIEDISRAYTKNRVYLSDHSILFSLSRKLFMNAWVHMCLCLGEWFIYFNLFTVIVLASAQVLSDRLASAENMINLGKIYMCWLCDWCRICLLFPYALSY